MYKRHYAFLLFENLVIAECLKRRFNAGRDSRLSFYRDSSGLEIDLLYPDGPDLIPLEIKSGQTINRGWFDNLDKFASLQAGSERTAVRNGLIVYGGDELQRRRRVTVTDVWTLEQALPKHIQS
ncbi:MAG: DUF4143 domain-containing protein [Planctomycetota bacterium]